LENIALNFLDYAVKEEKELLGSGRNKIRIEEVEISLLESYLAAVVTKLELKKLKLVC